MPSFTGAPVVAKLKEIINKAIRKVATGKNSNCRLLCLLTKESRCSVRDKLIFSCSKSNGNNI